MFQKIQQRAVEFNLTEHCNLRCAHCDHASPLLPRRFANVDDYSRDLNSLSGVFHCHELKLLGGEPLLHPRLIDFLEQGRASAISDTITVVTNGVLLHRMPDEVFRLIDKLWVNIYPGVTIQADFAKLRRSASEFGFRLKVRRINSFRQTLINTSHQDEHTIQKIYRHCSIAHVWSCHTVYDGYYFKCPAAAFLEPRLALKGLSVHNRDRDGIPIRDNPQLAEQLAAYLEDKRPLYACSYCLGTSGKELNHEQLNSDGIRDAIAADHPNPSHLLERNPIQIARREVVRLAGITGE
jgi:organic radical activating enzyme